MPRQIAGVPSDPKTWSCTPYALALEEVESTRPPWSRSRIRSPSMSASISSMHLLHERPMRRSGERDQERDYMGQERCSHRPRRTRCSANVPGE